MPHMEAATTALRTPWKRILSTPYSVRRSLGMRDNSIHMLYSSRARVYYIEDIYTTKNTSRRNRSRMDLGTRKRNTPWNLSAKATVDY